MWLPPTIRELGVASLRNSGLIHMGGEPDQLQILVELEPTVETELSRHDATREFWVPRDFFPIDSEGRIINRAEDLPEGEPLLTPTAQAAMIVNLLTEDNLPAYHRIIADNFGLDDAWGVWVNKWTAEENRHAYAMRAFLDLTGAVDTVQLETDRMAHMEHGYNINKDPLHTLAYVTFQELATRISHRKTGEACDDPIANALLARIAKDENMHMIFYRNLVTKAFEIAPNQTMRAVTDEVLNFAMPGATMKGFQSKSLLIAQANIYNLPIHKKDVIVPTLRHWKVFDRTDLTGDGEVARQELAAFVDIELEKRAGRFEGMRESGLLQRLIDRSLASEARG